VQLAVLELASAGLARGHAEPGTRAFARALVRQLVKRKVLDSPARVVTVLDLCTSTGHNYANWFPIRAVLARISIPPSPIETEALKRLRRELSLSTYAEPRKLVERIDEIFLGRTPRILAPGGTWSAQVLADISAFNRSARDAWRALVTHLLDAGDAKPSQKWEKELHLQLDAVGRPQFLERALGWLALGPMPGEPTTPQVPEHDANYLKGFVLALATYDDVAVARALADLGVQCFKKIPWHGPISARVGNACIRVLARLPGIEPVAQLGRLRTRVKYAVGLQLIERAFAEAAAREHLDPEELEEVAVPTFDLDATGTLRRQLTDHTAEIRIAGSDEVVLSWTTSAGRRQKGVPATVRESHAQELGQLKKMVKDIARVLPAQKARLESLLQSDRPIPFEKWRQRYVDHPLLGQMARRLVWHFAEGDRTEIGALCEGRIVDVEDRPIEWISPGTSVRTWHPLGRSPDVVLAWRRWLDRQGVVQPFKQAHREVYILTDAELATRVYSNRFAAHILRQHQFAALCRERGWRYTLQGEWDSANTPSHLLPHWNLAVEFWVDYPTDRVGVTGSGVFEYVFTDQVRFRRNGEPIPLDEVPALAFSEAMRDVDLFVGVCSVGNDPGWGDQGDRSQYGNYWQSYSFGDLSESARTRRAVLEELIPKLKIADRLRLEDRFLIVRGELATYKIHLGSTNIMIEPGSRYLCIVPERGAKSSEVRDVWLPFEGDGALAIILSKAFLLAADKKISDATILRQIRPG